MQKKVGLFGVFLLVIFLAVLFFLLDERVSLAPKPQQHLECVRGTCTSVNGAGVNQCAQIGADCDTFSEGFNWVSSVSQYGITWYFDRPYRVGQFANGDYWVVPDTIGERVRIVRITPEVSTLNVGGVQKIVHGWEVNPDSDVLQAFDERQSGFGEDSITFDVSRLPVLPYDARGGESLVKAISNLKDQPYGFGYYRAPLLRAGVLTVLNDVPPEAGVHTFRPPYYGDDKPLISTNSLDLSALPSLSPPRGAHYLSLAEVSQNLAPPQLEHFRMWLGGHMKPTLNGPGYGRELSIRNNEYTARLLLDDSVEDKLPALIQYVQYGLDLYYMYQQGVAWEAIGGYSTGRKMIVVMTSFLLNNEEMKQNLMTAPSRYLGPEHGYSYSDRLTPFDEDAQFYRSERTGEVLLGTRSEIFRDPVEVYWDITLNTNSNAPDPYGYIDGGWAPGDSYHLQRITSYKANALVLALLPEVRRVWNNDLLSEYVYRWVEEGVATQPDPCAPLTGTCVGGSNEGAACTTATDLSSDVAPSPGYCQSSYYCNTICTDGGYCNTATRRAQDYGVVYGPDPARPGQCILDTNPSDGIGRFPLIDGAYTNGGQGQTELIEGLWALWAYPVVCGDNIIRGNEECDDGGLEDGDGCSSSCRIESSGINNGLSFYYRFDGTMNDFSGYAVPASWIGTPQYTSSRRGSAALVDSANYILIPRNIPGTSQIPALTISVWAKKISTVSSGDLYLVYKGGHYNLRLQERDRLGSLVLTHNSAVFGGTTNQAIDSLDWHHYLLTYDGSITRTYLDGTEVSNSALAGLVGPVGGGDTWDIQLGGGTGATSFAIDEVRLYDRTLSFDEVQTLFLGF